MSKRGASGQAQRWVVSYKRPDEHDTCAEVTLSARQRLKVAHVSTARPAHALACLTREYLHRKRQAAVQREHKHDANRSVCEHVPDHRSEPTAAPRTHEHADEPDETHRVPQREQRVQRAQAVGAVAGVQTTTGP
jgi:hypothetical protein